MNSIVFILSVLLANSYELNLLPTATAFGNVPTSAVTSRRPTNLFSTTTTTENTMAKEEERQQRKREILKLLGVDDKKTTTTSVDPVLACPVSKDPLRISSESPLVEAGSTGVRVSLRTPDGATVYKGRTNTFYDLLSDGNDEDENENDDGSVLPRELASSLMALIPPPLRAAASFAGVDSYVPMRDLFTSPAVSFAYERGWRQGFERAGFPGADKEYEMVRDYFQPVAEAQPESSVVVDMSCATGLFTRRLVKSGRYDRVLGCDYSASMLDESRRRIVSASDLKDSPTRLELVRCDVAKLPMRSDSVDALHAGAAMHCWPELEAGLEEIYRVLRPGGRFFASTFLSSYFSGLRTAEGRDVSVQEQAFQYFESLDVLRDFVVNAGFDENKVTVEKLGAACAIIRCEK